MSDFDKKVAEGFAWEAGTRVVVQIASWVSTIWVARLLTPEDYGLVAISGIFTGLCLTFSVMGLTNALINKEDISETDKANVFWTSTLLALLFYGFLYAISPYIAAYYDSEYLEDIIRVAGLMVIISPLSVVPRALIMRDMQFKQLALVAMWTNLVVTILTLLLAFMGWKFWSLIIATVLAQFFELVYLLVLSSYMPSRPRQLKTVIPLYKFGVSILGARVISYLNVQWPVIVASSSFGEVKTGHFQMSRTLAQLPMSKVGEIFSKIAFPAFSRIKGDREKSKSVFLSMHRYMFLLIAPMFIGIALIAEELIPILLGDKWLAIVVPMQIICVTNVISGSAMIIPKALEGLGNPNASLKYHALIAVLSPLAMFYGAQWGLVGMLLCWALVIPVGYGYLLSVLFKSLAMTLGEFWRSISSACICVCLMAASIYMVDYYLLVMLESQWLVLIAKMLVGGISYLLAFILLCGDDLKQMIQLIRSRGA